MNIKISACLGGLIAPGAFLSQPAMADEWNKRTEFRFSAAVQIPGKIVPVFPENSEGHYSLATTVLAVPDYASDTPDKSTVQLEERPFGTPAAIRSWFYPGDNAAWEFVYSRTDNLATDTN
jgi:hypothetical protein